MKFPILSRILAIVAIVLAAVLPLLASPAPADAAGVISVIPSKDVIGPANNLVPTLDYPRDAVVNPQTNHLIVTNWYCELFCTLSSFQDSFGGLSFNGHAFTNSGTGFIGDTMLAFNPRTNHVWTAHEGDDFIINVWDDTPGGLVPVGPAVGSFSEHVTNIAVNPTTNHVFFTTWKDGGDVGFISLRMRVDDESEPLNTRMYRIDLDGNLAHGPMAVNPHTNHLFVLNSQEGHLEVFRDESFDEDASDVLVDAIEHVLTIPDIGTGRAIAVNPITGTIFITTADGILLMRDNGDSISVGGTMPVGSNPTDIAVDPGAGRVYVLDSGDIGGAGASVWVIEDQLSASPQLIESPIPLPGKPVAITVNPVTNHVFAVIMDPSQIVMLGDLVPTTLTADVTHASTTDETAQLSANVWLGPASDGIPAASSTGVVTFRVLTPDRTGQIGEVVAGGVFSTGRSVVTFPIPPGTPAGSYPVVVKYGDSEQIYGFSETETTLVISEPSLQVQADDLTWVAGAASQPPFTYTISGFVGGDDEGIVSGEVAFSTDAPAMPRVGEYSIEITGTLSAPGYNFNYSPGVLSVEFPSIDVTPNAIQAGSDALEVAVLGAGFGADMAVRWNGVELSTMVKSYTELRATVPAALLVEQGVGYVDVIDHLGGSTSPLAAVFVTSSGASVADSGIATSDSPSGSATVTAGTTTATASGSGTIAVASYASNPGGEVIFSNAGGYFDVNLAPESEFESVTVTSCEPDNIRTIAYWWDGSSWQIVSDQSYDAATGCITMTITDSTSPSLAQLAGTPFALGGKLLQTIDFPLIDDQIVGAQPVEINATASSGLPVSYIAEPGSACEISSQATVTLLGAGTCTITASQAGDDLYEAAPSVQQTFNISYGIRLLYDPVRTFASGNVFPIMVELVDANGAAVVSRDLTLTVVGISPDLPVVNVSGATFTYSPRLGPNRGYRFDLRTHRIPPGRYELLFTVTGDPMIHSAPFQVR